ncbi:ABC-2 type transport system permease protein [Gracilibacillus halotolerans]|uniref:ABC-2 type transport system permease protein n=1 Tax=Gracilibacillus halotolerans TaxID=74386 RepID=A0A841RLL1_9BACI|nr:ABC transporter permease subunit [Gracilibacillus halotolerans]MBB6512055.1 ABC-2 type transport system permease protein [Gracilibacillus halotolerans]
MNIATIKKRLTLVTKNNQESTSRGDAHTFWAIVQKEFSDYISSWRIIILLAIILLTCVGSLYTAVTTIQDAANASENAEAIGRDGYLFLQLFTMSDGTLPPFITFVGLLGPLLGIALGFDAINSERNKGTLSRLMAQPIPRDYVINGKFVAALLINSLLFFALGLLVMAFGIIILGIPPTAEEFFRIIAFLLLCIVYIAFWLNLGILFSVVFRQPATSALASMSIWLFFAIFFSMIINLVAKPILNSEAIASLDDAIFRQELIMNLQRLSPNYLFSESTTTLLSPSIRSLGPLTMEQTVGAVASPLPLSQSLLLIWPQLTGMIAATLICFAIAYLLFMRSEIRA